MKELTVPTASAFRRRAGVAEVAGNQVGQLVGDMGARLFQIGQRVEKTHADAEFEQTQLAISNDLAELRQKYANINDADAIDTGYAEEAAALAARYEDAATSLNKVRVANYFRGVNDRHALALGQRAIDLRKGQGVGRLAEYEETALREAIAAAGDEERTTVYTTYAERLADAVERNYITEEEASASLRKFRDQADRGRATRLLSENPADLLARIDKGEFDGLDPLVKERVRAGAVSSVARDRNTAAREAERQQRETLRAYGDGLDEVIRIARAGRISEAEALLLADPAAREHPRYDEAVAAVDLRNEKPEFAALNLDAMDAVIAAERKRPVRKEFQTRRLREMEAIRDAAAQQWENDPIEAARDLTGAQIADLPEFDAENPAGFAAALRRRKAEAETLVDTGYVAAPDYFTEAERKNLRALADPGTGVTDRLALARSLAEAFGTDAGAALRELGVSGVFGHAGGLVAAGGSEETAALILRGESAQKAGSVQLPPKSEKLAVIRDQLGGLLEGETFAAVRDAADAIYAAEAAGIDPKSDDALELYERALHRAMGGGYDRRGNQTGGVQEVNGRDTLLPIGVTADDAEQLIGGLLAATVGKRVRYSGAREPIVEEATQGAADLWQAVSQSGGLPEYAGAALTPAQVKRLQLVAVGADLYELRITRGRRSWSVTDSVTGGNFRFSFSALRKELDR